MQRTIEMFRVSFAIGAVLLVTCHVPAWAHAKIAQSTPEANAVLAEAPREVRVQFTQAPESSFSNIQVVDAEGKELTSSKAVIDSSDPKVMHVPLPALKPGTYRVQWGAVTADGHRTKGEYSFTVK